VAIHIIPFQGIESKFTATKIQQNYNLSLKYQDITEACKLIVT